MRPETSQSLQESTRDKETVMYGNMENLSSFFLVKIKTEFQFSFTLLYSDEMIKK